MKCLSCDCILTDFESTRKSFRTGEYLDLCDNCIVDIKEDLEVVEQEDLRTQFPIEIELENYDE